MTSDLIEFRIHLTLKSESYNCTAISLKRAKNIEDLLKEMNADELKTWIYISSDDLENEFYFHDYLALKYPLLKEGIRSIQCPRCRKICHPEKKLKNGNILYSEHDCKPHNSYSKSYSFQTDHNGHIKTK